MKLQAIALLLTACCSLVAGADLQPTADYRGRTIYFLLTDRFNPHQPYAPYVDPEYPDATNTVNCFIQTCNDEVEYRKYWGGDIQGVIEKADYLKNLGISAVWLTPLMENVRSYEGGTGYGTGYHGYWIQNYYRVNEHFGTWEDVHDLSAELHEHGMRYIQDITLNHSSPYDNHNKGKLYQTSSSDQIFIKSYLDDIDPATGTHYYKHYQDTCACKKAANEADYDWTYWQLHHCLLADLSGYDQHNPDTANYLLGAGKLWIDNGVDDYRLDAVKFPFPDFIADYTRTMRDHLAALERPAPYIVGEWSNGGLGDSKSLCFANDYQRYGTNILDFQLAKNLNRFIGGNYEVCSEQFSAVQLDSYLHARVSAFQGRDTWQGTFLDNHDQIRTVVRLQKLGLTDESERDRRMDLGSVLLLTLRGIPIIYYGDEQYLAHFDDGGLTKPGDVNTGDDDPWNRPGMQQWDQNTPAFRTIGALAKLRRESPAIWKGDYVTLYSSPDTLVFERVENGEQVVVAVNRGGDRTISIPCIQGLPKGTYSGLIENASQANQGNYLKVGDKNITLHLNRISSLVAHF